jgi:hypothetical protein
MNAIRLASRFNYNRVSIAPNAVGGISRLCGASQEAYSEDVLRQFVPSIFAETAHESRSARYGYVPTIEVVRGLADEGFKPVFACEARARDESKAGFTKHMIRFRHQDVIGKDMAEKPEVVLLNSHDGSTTYQIFGGVFRTVCSNGLIVGDSFAECRVPHKSNAVEKVIEGTYEVVSEFERAVANKDEMKAIELRSEEAAILAEAAHELRFDPESPLAEAIPAPKLLLPRRSADLGGDLWTRLNVIQENVIRGDQTGWTRDANGRRRRASSRPVGGIDQNVKLNRALWTLAEKMAELKGVKLAA